jgi:hypothetical protein
MDGNIGTDGLSGIAINRSDKQFSQLVTWHPWNFTGDGDSGPHGQWLRCLKSTKEGDRQLVWCDGALRAVVTFTGWVRNCDGYYEGWGSITRLPRPVARKALVANPATRGRFDARGIHAFQGLPIRVQPGLGRAIGKMTGLGKTDGPLDAPDYNEEPILWAGLHGLAPESYIEAAVSAHAELWRELGFAGPPERQVKLGAAGRCDLIRRDAVGEAKRAVTVTNGPDQLERYLSFLCFREGWPRKSVKGILLQCATDTSRAVIDRLESSDYRLALWSLTTEEGDWCLDRLV